LHRGSEEDMTSELTVEKNVYSNSGIGYELFGLENMDCKVEL